MPSCKSSRLSFTWAVTWLVCLDAVVYVVAKHYVSATFLGCVWRVQYSRFVTMGDLADCLYHYLLTRREDNGGGSEDEDFLTPEHEKQQRERMTAFVVRLVHETPAGNASAHLVGLRYFIKGDTDNEHDGSHLNVRRGCLIS